MLSAANNYQLDLNKITCRDQPIPAFTNELEKAKWHRQLPCINLYIADGYVIERVKDFI